MEPKNIQCRDPDLEESFSFSNSSSSPLAIFSDSDADDDYIEISLQPAHVRLNNGGADDFDGDEEMELRISFSTSCVPLPDDIKTTTESYMTSCKSSSSSSSSSSTFTFSSWSESQRKSPEEYSRLNESKAGNRFVDTFISSFKVSNSEIDDRSTEISNLELVQSSGTRKASKLLTTTKMNSGFMMKFFIKFRETLKLKTLVASFLKASQANGSLYKDKLCDEPFLACNNRTIIEKGSSGKNNKLELKFDAVKGILLEAMNISTSRGRKDRKAKSCPVSTKSSPLHQKFVNANSKISATDNSIQAAIAHCKRSFHPNI